GATTRMKIKAVTQGKGTVDDYVVKFEEFEGDTGYNDEAHIALFKAGLNQNVAQKIYTCQVMLANLVQWKEFACRFDHQYREYQQERPATTQQHQQQCQQRPQQQQHQHHHHAQPSTSRTVSTPVKQEPQDPAARSTFTGSCYRCGGYSHTTRECPSP